MNDTQPKFVTDASILFMKVGDHAGETFDQIIARKRQEREAAGRIFWGYGGSACHPLTQVQPFFRLAKQAGENPILVMQGVRSMHDEDRYPAEQYSEDGVNWHQIPDGIRVTGSKYALVLDEILPGDFMFNPRDYEVGIGPSRGKSADEYLSGRTDKACLRHIQKPSGVVIEDHIKKIDFYARLRTPYAVLLR